MTAPVDRDQGFVSKLEGEFIECRALRHQFDLIYFGVANRIPDFKSSHGPSVIVMQAGCRRCGVLREMFFNPYNAAKAAMGQEFVSFSHRYRYPTGYTWKKSESSMERPVHSDYAYEMFNRFNRNGPMTFKEEE